MGKEFKDLVEGLLGMARRVLEQSQFLIEDQALQLDANELALRARQLREQGRDLVSIAEAILLVAGSDRSA
jgi:uncharacterized protein YjbK